MSDLSIVNRFYRKTVCLFKAPGDVSAEVLKSSQARIVVKSMLLSLQSSEQGGDDTPDDSSTAVIVGLSLAVVAAAGVAGFAVFKYKK